MVLGIFPPLGSSLTDMEKSGQKERFLKYYLLPYANSFDAVNFFPYTRERNPSLPKNSREVLPPISVHRYLYGLLIPFLCFHSFSHCSVFRCFHLSGTVPAIIGKIFFHKKFVFNYNYDYKEWAKIEGKSYLVPLIKLLELFAFWTADRVFVSDSKMNAYGRCYKNKNQIDLIPNAVDPEIFLPKVKRKSSGKIEIFSVGRLEKQKNYSLLIEALSLVRKPLHLTIVGKGSEEENLKALAKKLAVPFTLIPKVPHLQLPSYYASADLYIQTSLMEAPVKTLLEAMSCALPVIGTKVPGIDLVIDNGRDGLLTDSLSPELAAKIDQIISDPKFAHQLGQAARQKIIQNYNLPKIVNREIEILQNV